MSRKTDTLTRGGALDLASEITDYWRSKGYPGIIAHQFELPEAPGVWGVRSNMVGGLPPGGAHKRMTPDTKVDALSVNAERIV